MDAIKQVGFPDTPLTYPSMPIREDAQAYGLQRVSPVLPILTDIL